MRQRGWLVSVGVFVAVMFVGCGDDVVPSRPIEDRDAGADAAEPFSCEPGGRYVCNCDNGRKGNKFCSWAGDAFTECTLCGPGFEPKEETSIVCILDPDASKMEVYTPCPTTGDCKPFQCIGRKCWHVPAQPSAVIADDSNNCTQLMCDGFGGIVVAPDPNDCDGVCSVDGTCVQP